MKTGYKVSDAMTQEPIVVGPNDSVVDCAKMMKEHGVGGIIVEEKGKLVGICTEQDIVYNIVADEKSASELKMKDIMCDNVRTISVDLDIFEALMKMRDFNCRRLPVVANDGKLVGMLTSKDVLKIEPQLFDLLVDTIELREEENKPVKVKEADDEVDEIIEG